MENSSSRQLIGGGFDETIMSVVPGPSAAAPDVNSNFHTALEECHLSSSDEVAHGDCSGAGSSMDPPKYEFFSPRVEEMMRSKSQFSSDVEHEIEHARVHWTETTETTETTSGVSDSSSEDNMIDYEEVKRENAEVYAELMEDRLWKHRERGEFFRKGTPVGKLGRKIGEGGQAEIFELINVDGTVHSGMLYKVFKRGSHLSDLRKQWPYGILRRQVPLSIVDHALMLQDGRFAFGMTKCWGDLRKLIDEAMQAKKFQAPPFPYEWNSRMLHAKGIMREIALHMDILHMKNIIHRDLKAANVLLRKRGEGHSIIVADFECSIGNVGTGFWRAPEILLALKNRSATDFSKKVDVYSFGMTCFEIVTGRLPFEGELVVGRASNDLIIEGLRPKLPSGLDVTLKDVIERCWNPIPNERPSFSEIYMDLVFKL